MSTPSVERRRFSIHLRRLLWIASALITGVVAGLTLHFKLGDMRAPEPNRISGEVTGISAGTLFDAINNESLEQVERLIRLGSDVNTRDADLETPLMRAAFGGEPRIVERLLAAGSSVNARDKSGQTAMHFAAAWHEESPQIIAALIAAGAAVDVVDEDGQTPLMLASRGESVAKVKTLLANGTNPNAADNGGRTALMCAVGEHTEPRHLVERVQLLLDHGADPNARTNDGQTALDLASQRLELYSDPEFTGIQKAMLDGAPDWVQKMDFDSEMDAEMRKTFAELSRMTQESNAAAKKNFPIVMRILRELTERPVKQED